MEWLVWSTKDIEICSTDWKFISKRLITVSVQRFPNTESESYVITYAPNEDASTEDKVLYFEDSQETTDEINRKVTVLEDLKGRVGNIRRSDRRISYE